jgi:hypothetical protein
MKSELETREELEQYQTRLKEMIDEPYNPGQPQLTNIFCVASYIDALKWVLSDDNN